MHLTRGANGAHLVTRQQTEQTVIAIRSESVKAKMYFRRFALIAVALFTADLLPLHANVSNAFVTPSSITFTSSNPDGSVTGAPSTTIVLFKTTGNPSSFTVHVKAVTPKFAGCNTPPVSAVTITCSSASGLTCAGAAPLRNIANGTKVATGSGNHGTAGFVITYAFQDSWKYLQGDSCSISTQIIYTEP